MQERSEAAAPLVRGIAAARGHRAARQEESVAGERLSEGQRVGRFVIVRDRDGHVHAVAAGAVGALCENDEGALLLLPGGRMLQTSRSMETLLAWLDGRG